MSEHPISALIRTEPFQIKSNKNVHASHECSEQCTKPHDGPQLLVHHLQNKLLRLVHIHLVDTLADDGADVDALKYLRKMLGDDGLVDGNHRILSISELRFLTSQQVFHRPRQEFICLTLNEIADDGITVLLQYITAEIPISPLKNVRYL